MAGIMLEVAGRRSEAGPRAPAARPGESARRRHAAPQSESRRSGQASQPGAARPKARRAPPPGTARGAVPVTLRVLLEIKSLTLRGASASGDISIQSSRLCSAHRVRLDGELSERNDNLNYACARAGRLGREA